MNEGLTDDEVVMFGELLIKSNDIQLPHLLKTVKREIEKRQIKRSLE